jgi:hypothetical protein
MFLLRSSQMVNQPFDCVLFHLRSDRMPDWLDAPLKLLWTRGIGCFGGRQPVQDILFWLVIIEIAIHDEQRARRHLEQTLGWVDVLNKLAVLPCVDP